jgi:hypothetical protein
MPSTWTNGRRRDRETQKGHGTGAFGPSDPTDIAGASGIIESDVTGLDHAADEGIDGTPTRTAAAPSATPISTAIPIRLRPAST